LSSLGGVGIDVEQKCFRIVKQVPFSESFKYHAINCDDMSKNKKHRNNQPDPYKELRRQALLIFSNYKLTKAKYKKYPVPNTLDIRELVETAEKYYGENDYGAALYYARLGKDAWLEHHTKFSFDGKSQNALLDGAMQNSLEDYLVRSHHVISGCKKIIAEEGFTRVLCSGSVSDGLLSILEEHSQYLIDCSYLEDSFGKSYSPNWKKY